MTRLLLVLLAACSYGAHAGSPDRDAIDAVADEWEASELPDVGDCFELIEVRRHDTRESYVDACDGLHPGLYGEAASRSAGCLTTALRGPRGVQVAIVHVAPGYHGDMGLVQHEALHRVCWCAWRNADAWHSRPRVWAAAGGAGSVQARAKPPN